MAKRKDEQEPNLYRCGICGAESLGSPPACTLTPEAFNHPDHKALETEVAEDEAAVPAGPQEL